MKPAAYPGPRIALACGGTGGHLFPGLAVAEQLVQRGCSVTLLVSPKEVDQQALKSVAGLDVVTLPVIGLSSGKTFAFLNAFCRSYAAARKLFLPNPPQAVLGMGGFTSVPPLLAGRRLGTLTFLHESNAIPGRANRWLSWTVGRAFVGFPSAISRLHQKNTVICGTPVRSEFQPRDAGGCRAELGLDPNRPLVLVMGGSQGASGINELVLRSLPSLAKLAPEWQWLHLAGSADLPKVQDAYRVLQVKGIVRAFFARMDLALGAATAAVSRAGASSLAEIAALRVPSVLVPYPAAVDDHQTHNARAFELSGAARLLPQNEATPEVLGGLLMDLVQNQARRQAMRLALAQWHKPEAAQEIARVLLADIGRVGPAPISIEHTSFSEIVA